MKEYIQKTYNQPDNAFKRKSSMGDDYTDLIKSNVCKSDMLLDLGCGGGRLTRSISKYVRKIIGIDFSRELIRFAINNTSERNVSYKLMDAENLSFPNNVFDMIVSHAVINKKMCKANLALKSAYKILKPKGKIIVKMIYSTWGKEFNFSGGYNSSEIKMILKNIGYTNITIEIQRQKFRSTRYDDIAWIKSTEAVNLSPKKDFEEFFSKSKKNYCFDDSFMIVYAVKGN